MTQGQHNHIQFTVQILIGLALGIIAGLLFQHVPFLANHASFLPNHVFKTLGDMFIRLIRMLVVPIVFVSIICGAINLMKHQQLGLTAIKTLALYLFTTAAAISLALLVSSFFHIGEGSSLVATSHFTPPTAPSLKQTLINFFPNNPIAALAKGDIIQIILFALLFGIAIAVSRPKSDKLISFFESSNDVLMNFVLMIMKVAPLGVFCLMTAVFANTPLKDILQLLNYFMTVLLCLILQLLIVYSGLLYAFCRITPLVFFKKIYGVMMFAFSISSSSATLPVTLRTAKERLNLSDATREFVIPLGATVNMDGTAIMQGVATVFIAHLYHIPLTLLNYLTVIGMATLASIGTAGVPGVGIITLAMVLEQVGIPVQGIAMIIGVDRLLDMARTAVNVAGDLTVATLIDR